MRSTYYPCKQEYILNQDLVLTKFYSSMRNHVDYGTRLEKAAESEYH